MVSLKLGTTHISNWTTNGETFEPFSFKSTFTQAPIVFDQIPSNGDSNVSTHLRSDMADQNYSDLLSVMV